MLTTGALAARTVTLRGGCASSTGQTNDATDPARTRPVVPGTPPARLPRSATSPLKEIYVLQN